MFTAELPGGAGATAQQLVCNLPYSSTADDFDANGIITPEDYAAYAKAWQAAGAELIGGCCGVGPAHMAMVAAALSAVD
jgi:S-methylmethionine-dependent homocysteine/selenocysteine methylase